MVRHFHRFPIQTTSVDCHLANRFNGRSVLPKGPGPFELFAWGQGDKFGFPGIDFVSPIGPIGFTQFGHVQQITMSAYHALILGSEGNVHSTGSNFSGELGLGHQKEVAGFNKIDQFDSVEVLKVQAGYSTSAALAKSGEVYVFGKWGETIYSTPHLISGLTDVVDISMSGWHILALTGRNELFAWGDNDDGKCGVGSEDDYISKPTRVAGFEDKDILQISAGLFTSLIKYKTK